jgi:hypothetical protein
MLWGQKIDATGGRPFQIVISGVPAGDVESFYLRNEKENYLLELKHISPGGRHSFVSPIIPPSLEVRSFRVIQIKPNIPPGRDPRPLAIHKPQVRVILK